jgi:hypothetical protein
MYPPNKEGKVIAIQGASNTDKSTLVGICNQLPGTLSTTGPSELVTSDSTKSGRELRNISGFELVCLPDVHHSEKDAISMKSVKILTSTDSVADENGSVIVMSKAVIYTTNNLVQQPTNYNEWLVSENLKSFIAIDTRMNPFPFNRGKVIGYRA